MYNDMCARTLVTLATLWRNVNVCCCRKRLEVATRASAGVRIPYHVCFVAPPPPPPPLHWLTSGAPPICSLCGQLDGRSEGSEASWNQKLAIPKTVLCSDSKAFARHVLSLLSVTDIATAICTMLPKLVSAENAILYMNSCHDEKLMRFTLDSTDEIDATGPAETVLFSGDVLVQNPVANPVRSHLCFLRT